MKKLFVILLLVIPKMLFASEKTYGSANGTVMYVHDGDTLTVTLDGEWPDIIGNYIGVRVYGIDTRELKAGGEAAREYVRKLLPVGARVRLSEMRRDKYFRIVAKVGFNCNDYDTEWPLCEDLSLKLIKENYAVPYMGGTKEGFSKEIK